MAWPRSWRSGLRAVDTVEPGLGVSGLLTPRAAAVYPQTTVACYDALSDPGSFGGVPMNEILRTDVDLAPLFAAVRANDPEHLSIKTPVRIEQGDADETVFAVFPLSSSTSTRPAARRTRRPGSGAD